jgi:Ala-tRNA(Pro) deacylase
LGGNLTEIIWSPGGQRWDQNLPGVEAELIAFLDTHGVSYERHDHPAVFTCEEARRWVPPMEAAETKNVFLRDRKGKRHFLVVVGYDKSVDLKALAPLLQADKLSLGSAERLQKFLAVEPGSVTILAVFADREHAVEVVFDTPIAQAAALRCHPMVNTATLAVPQSDIARFLQATGHQLTVLDVPAR